MILTLRTSFTPIFVPAVIATFGLRGGCRSAPVEEIRSQVTSWMRNLVASRKLELQIS